MKEIFYQRNPFQNIYFQVQRGRNLQEIYFHSQNSNHIICSFLSGIELVIALKQNAQVSTAGYAESRLREWVRTGLRESKGKWQNRRVDILLVLLINKLCHTNEYHKSLFINLSVLKQYFCHTYYIFIIQTSKMLRASDIIRKQLSLVPKDSSFYQSNLKLLQNPIPNYPFDGTLTIVQTPFGALVSSVFNHNLGVQFDFKAYCLTFGPIMGATGKINGEFYVDPNTLVGKLNFRVSPRIPDLEGNVFELSRGQEIVGSFVWITAEFGNASVSGTGDFKRDL